MSRLRRVKIVVLNVVTHPHSPELYAELFRAAFRLNRSLEIAGDLRGKIVSCYAPTSDAPLLGITGEFFRYIELDPDADWFNVEEGEPASDEERASLNIPDNLKPHLQRLRYAFFPKLHRLVIVTKWWQGSMSPGRLADFFKQLLNDPALASKFPHAEVTLEQAPDTLARIFDMPLLHELEIEIKRPSADEDDPEGEIMEQLEKENVAKQVTILTAPAHGQLKPSQETVSRAKVAVSNGFVVARGRDEENKPTVLKTQDHPLVKTYDFSEANQGLLEVFLSEAAELAKNRK